jgi:Raf kinase inhibitor-like YbhB/YbcL family protein
MRAGTAAAASRRNAASALRAALIGAVTVTGAALVPAATEAQMALKITSPAFEDNAAIPAKYTCEGDDLSPPLSWSGVPDGTKSLVLIVDDPDAPDPAAPQRVWVHWVLYNLPPGTEGLAENANKLGLPAGTKAGLNDWKRADYGGPCPPIGRHRYFHKLYALDTVLSGLDKPTKGEVEGAMKGHVLGEAQIIGTYQKV